MKGGRKSKVADFIARNPNKSREFLFKHVFYCRPTQSLIDRHPKVVAFNELVSTAVEDFVEASRAIGEPLTTVASLVRQAFDKELAFITYGVTAPKPDDANLNNQLQPLCDVIREIQEFRDRKRDQSFFNHLSTVSESIVALSWVSVTPAPAQFIRDMRDAGEYFGNRVLSSNKGNIAHTDWILKWNEVLKSLEKYVREHHLAGFAWAAYMHGLPPPPPPAPGFEDYSKAGGDDRYALFSQINQGDSIVRMLRPVRRDDASDAGVQSSARSASAPTARQAPVKTYPPKFLLDGRKWRVEHQNNNFGLTVDNDNMSESLAMFKCNNVGLQVMNKMNGVTIDNCKSTTVVLSDIISSVEAIRCDRLKIQCMGKVPLISIDNCDSVQIFVTANSEDVEVISSKSTSCNICLLAQDGDYVELAMPEQIRTVIQDRALASSVVEKI